MSDDVRVLFIEDDPTVAQMYKLKLELDGYQVTMAKDGEEGLQLATDVRPDIIFLELNLPCKDGRQLLAEIKTDEDLRYIPVVILTDSRDEDDILTSYEHRADGYLIKPISLAELASTSVRPSSRPVRTASTTSAGLSLSTGSPAIMSVSAKP